MSDVLWELVGVSLGGVGVPRLDDVSVEIREGVTAVLGCSGAGKTSLLNLLVGYEAPDTGMVAATLPTKGHALPVYWAPQTGGLWPHLTVREHLELVSPAEADRDQAMAVLASLDVDARADSRPHELSQGERSRVAVARALVADAAVLVMDEPFASVDVARLGTYWEVVREHVARSGASLVFATHAPAAVLAEAKRVICLTEGRLLYEGGVDDLYWRPRTREEANCLGEGNWLEPDEARLWLDRQEASPRCFRPEQIAVAVAEESPIVVRSSRFKGAVAEVELEHEEAGERRRFYHRPVSDALPRGARILLRVLVGLLAFVLAGCDGGGGPSLAVKEVHYWAMPPDGVRVPSPRVVAIGHSDEVFVIDRVGRVLVLDGERGQLLRQWRMPDTKLGHPEGACVLKDGRLAVADTHYHRVVLFDAKGNVVGIFGSRGTGPGEFLFPVAVVHDAHGDLYVCEYGGNDRVQKFTVDGRLLLAFGSFGTGPEQFQRPAGMVWHDGKIYVADAINNRIQMFTDDGKFLGTLGQPTQGLPLHFPYDITIGSDGALYVVEYGAGRVTKVGLDGRLLGRFGRTGKGEGQFHTPWGIAIDSRRRLRVADTGNRRIVELKL